jgi:hypothetical protein
MSSKRFVSVVLLLPLLVALQGCLVTATVDAKGGGTMTMKYRLARGGKIDQARRQMGSPQVKVEKASIDKQNWATFELSAADVRKLSTAPFFRSTVVDLTDGEEKGTKKLEVKVIHNTQNRLPPALVEYYGRDVVIAITLPGEIKSSNATSTEGKTATWKYPINDFFAAKENLLQVTYQP